METEWSLDGGVVPVLLNFTYVTSSKIAFTLKALHSQSEMQEGYMTKEKYTTCILTGKAQQFHFQSKARATSKCHFCVSQTDLLLA